jgi:hypothetical protein
MWADKMFPPRMTKAVEATRWFILSNVDRFLDTEEKFVARQQGEKGTLHSNQVLISS